MTPKILCIDGMNAFHRARSGFTAGDHAVVYNFFRQFRALVEMHQPTRVYVVMEGTPEKRIALLPEYKANRKIDGDSAKALEMAKFFYQVGIAGLMLELGFPVSVVRHPTFEADDTIYNLIKRSSTAVPWVVASNDSDFTQLLDEFEHVKVYNPMKKEFLDWKGEANGVKYSYVHWKALRGDPSDNIPKVPGFSDAKALKQLTVPGSGTKFLSDAALVEMWRRNCELVRFAEWTDEEAAKMESSSPTKNWPKIKQAFDNMGFKSITDDKPWAKFVATFDHLWG